LNFTNPRWRTAAILRTVTSSYLSNLLTDFFIKFGTVMHVGPQSLA